jgi:hypothetical protein
LPLARQNKLPAGRTFRRNSLRLEAKFDGLKITIPLLELNEIIELHLTKDVKTRVAQTSL